MTPEAQRIAIAEACGISVCPNCMNEIDPDICHCGDDMKFHGQSSGHNPVPMGCTCGYNDQSKVSRNTAPDYLNDLNAMHEAEKNLHRSVRGTYVRELGKLVNDINFDGTPFTDALVMTTAAQRAEAFLKTIGRWVS